MKLLFDQNLSFKLCRQLADIFPDSSQVRLLRMAEAHDRDVWDHAKANGFVLVSQDADFADMATLYGPPPKVIWLRCGNQNTDTIEARLRSHKDELEAFEHDETAACWEIY
jgi:predicted nuclease of predicted toxin-antitoxin system